MKLPGSPYHLALFRIGIGIQLLYAVSTQVFPLFLAVGKQQSVHTLFPDAMTNLIADHLVNTLVLICQVTSFLLIIGLFTRVILPILTVAFLLLFNFYYLGADAPVHWLYFWFPLVLLCFANSHHVWSVDSLLHNYGERRKDRVQYRWPVEMSTIWFVYIYFAAGLAKIFPLYKGANWIYGSTSHQIIYNRFLDSPFYYLFGKPFFNYAEVSWPFALLSGVAVLLELATIAMLFTRRYHLVLFSMVYTMHLFLYLCGVASFAQMSLVLGIALINPLLFERYERKFGLYPRT